MELKKAKIRELDKIFKIYKKYMYKSTFLKVGDNFVKRYINIILNSDYSITFVLKEKKIHGFIIGACDRKKLFFNFLLDLKLNFYLLSFFFKNPSKIFIAKELLNYIFNDSLRKVKSELLFIAIEPSYRNKGWGRKLILKTLKWFKMRDVERVKVIALSKNVPVNSLLNDLNFSKEKSMVLFGKKMNLYCYEIN